MQKLKLNFEKIDSIREMSKYSSEKIHDSDHGHLDAELQHSMKLFRAQRNFYIAGFALFLCLSVIYQFITFVINIFEIILFLI